MMRPTVLALAASLSLSAAAPARAPLPRVDVHAGGRYLQTADGRPFFWLGDTAWQLIHSTTREECSYYLRTRASQGFTVIQAVALAEMDGVRKPSALGLRPFTDDDPSRPNEAYFDRVVEIVDEAGALGLYVALLPTWGDKVTAPWGAGPLLFRKDNLPVARGYGQYLGRRLKDRTNVIWMLGGDRPPRVDGPRDRYPADAAVTAGFAPDENWIPIWREMASGIADGLGRRPLILYHPNGGPQSTSAYLHQEPWLSVNGMQSGHGSGHDVPVWEWVTRDRELAPAKPTLDLEPNYEDHPVNPWPRWDPALGYFRDHDVRRQAYRSVFAGACGVTYGHHAIWPFASARNGVINHADRDWIDATHRPGGRQMVYLRRLIESRPFFERVPDQSLIASPVGDGAMHLRATRDAAGTYAFVYFPQADQPATIDLARLKASRLRAWWYDPRTGIGTLIGELDGGRPKAFTSPSHGPDWVLVIDDAAAGYGPPGL